MILLTIVADSLCSKIFWRLICMTLFTSVFHLIYNSGYLIYNCVLRLLENLFEKKCITYALLYRTSVEWSQAIVFNVFIQH